MSVANEQAATAQQSPLSRLLRVEERAQRAVREARTAGEREVREAKAEAERLLAEAREQAEADAQRLLEVAETEAAQPADAPVPTLEALTEPDAARVEAAVAHLVAWVTVGER